MFFFFFLVFFFFQAEDGIRDRLVTGVQTCALPILVAASGFLPGQQMARAWRIMWRHHGRTQSPNAGWTMSGMAGALGVQLQKVDPELGYTLGEPDRPIEPSDISRAVQSMYLVGFFGLTIALVITFARGTIF